MLPEEWEWALEESDRVVKRLMEEEGLPAEEVLWQLQQAILTQYYSPEPEIDLPWKEISQDGMPPAFEEVLAYVYRQRHQENGAKEAETEE